MRNLFCKAQRCVGEVIERVTSWAAWVWERAVREPGYVETLASLVVALADLTVRDQLHRRLLRELVLVLLVALRGFLRGPRSRPAPGPWALPDDDGDPDDLGFAWA